MTCARTRLAPLLLAGAVGVVALAALDTLGAKPAEEGKTSRPQEAVAVIVNPANACPDPTFEEIRAILTLERQFWKDGKRIVLILPPGGSAEKQVLLNRVYRQTDADLRKTWARRLFAGEIPAVPTSLRTSEALIGAVRHSPGAIAVVPASAAVPPGVRVLAISGKHPGEPGYPLSADGS